MTLNLQAKIQKPNQNSKKYHLIVTCFSLLVLSCPAAIAHSETYRTATALEQLSTSDRTALENGEVVISEAEGKYTARILIDASAAEVWEVLTDYSNFQNFIPNVVSSEILESEENRTIIEQVSEQEVLLFKVKSRIRTENIETEDRRIDFRLVEGDLAQLQGSWTLESIASESTEETTQILLTQEVEVEPERGTPISVFNDLFQDALQETMTSIRDEVKQRKTL
jgi:ribosome-associated toxin RatA of RatAB toxin-antitoxin module